MTEIASYMRKNLPSSISTMVVKVNLTKLVLVYAILLQIITEIEAALVKKNCLFSLIISQLFCSHNLF